MMIRQIVGKINVSRKSLIAGTIWITCAVAGSGQGNVAAQHVRSVKTPAYEVVSIRPCKSTGYSKVDRMPNGLSVRNFTLWQLMFGAYDLYTEDQVSGLPGWAFSSQFDVEAKMDDLALATFQKLTQEDQARQLHLMNQSLLADRFKLKIHHENKERSIYALVIAKGGAKLTSDATWSGGMSGGGRIEYRGAPIDYFIRSLSSEVGRTVVDKTGLTGTYDFIVKFAPDEMQGSNDSEPSLFTALEEQLGLRLVSTKGLVDTIVVDHVEKPSAN